MTLMVLAVLMLFAAAILATLHDAPLMASALDSSFCCDDAAIMLDTISVAMGDARMLTAAAITLNEHHDIRDSTTQDVARLAEDLAHARLNGPGDMSARSPRCKPAPRRRSGLDRIRAGCRATRSQLPATRLGNAKLDVRP